MSVQFGRWNLDGRPVDAAYLRKVRGMLAPYGPDGEGTYIKDSVAVLYRPFYTTKESRRETQPVLLPSGEALTWDGRLDNREDLVPSLRDPLSNESTDAAIVAAAYGRWGTDCFARLIGDWALAIWNPRERSVILAKDFIGTRHLYYAADEDMISWSTILDPLVLLAGRTFTLEEEYIAGWLGQFPATHLTPYIGISSVPPSCFVCLKPGSTVATKYWDFDPGKKIRYENDAEYEEHFRMVFKESVRRRLRSDSPVLAELSGGMDSSSIVCMADVILAEGKGETPRLDTVSYYDDSEPNWNEKPYFTKVEEKRGRVGCHIKVAQGDQMASAPEIGFFRATPGSPGPLSETRTRLSEYVDAMKNRTLLSGIGGDEFTGGVPTPTPELADLLTELKIRSFAAQLRVWSLNKRRPWIQLLFETVEEFLPRSVAAGANSFLPPRWINEKFARRNWSALRGYPSRLKFLGDRPSFQQNQAAVNLLRRQLVSCLPSATPPYVKHYPFLDRDLLEFLLALPRVQLLQPGQRRSLLRRAVTGTVPVEILNRRRKAYVIRGFLEATSELWKSATLTGLHTRSQWIAGDAQLADALAGLQGGRCPADASVTCLYRAALLELWMRDLNDLCSLGACMAAA